jgi:UDP-2,3-diacylglucosamine pyrophosphatase LpxH
VISDLHLGGEYAPTPAGRGFRLNTHVAELVEFVRSLAAEQTNGSRTELVINGDMVDFQTEADVPVRDGARAQWNPFTASEDTACAKLQSIVDRDPSFFDALKTLLDSGARLTILSGSADIELGLPAVRRKLRDLIGVRPGHDFELITSGEAYSVGDALIEPGNRYDSWNTVDHDSLRRVCSLLSRRQSVPEKYDFDAPAGRKMVAWVVNPIKQDYKFIDLLKPATDAAVPLLLALEPGYRVFLVTVAKSALQARGHRMEKAALPSFGGDISSQSGDMGGLSTMDSFGSDISSFGDDPKDELDEILRSKLGDEGARQFTRSLAPPDGASENIGSDISTASVVDRALGLFSLLRAKDDADIGARLPALLKALRALQPDRLFDLDYEPAQEYADAAKELTEGGFRYIVFGHTHFAKQIDLGNGRWYLNTGAWADVMQLPPEILDADEDRAVAQLGAFVQDVAGGQLRGWTAFRPTYVRLDLDTGDRVVQCELGTAGGNQTAAVSVQNA